MKELIKKLKALIKVLEEEKEALIKNDGEKIVHLVKVKSEYTDALIEFKGLDIENDETAMKLIGKINDLQEINMLLTKQALAYQNAILESISKNINNINKSSNTYSSKGSYESKNNINLIDQSI